MPRPGTFIGPHTAVRLSFRAAISDVIDGEVTANFENAPSIDVIGSVQPNPHARMMLPGLAETYENTYNIIVAYDPRADKPDIHNKMRTVIGGWTAEVISVSQWPSHLEILVGTMPTKTPWPTPIYDEATTDKEK